MPTPTVSEQPAATSSFKPFERRVGMLATSLVLFAMSLAALLAPYWLVHSTQTLLGVLLIAGSVLETFQVMLGHARFGAVTKGTLPFIISAILHFIAGSVLLLWPNDSAWVLGMVMIAAIAIEGLLILYLSYRLRSVPMRIMLILSGAVSLLVVVYVLMSLGNPGATRPIAYLLGGKLLMLAGMFGYIALSASDEDLRKAYGGAITLSEPQVGGVYAVFYGPAFHCGVYVDHHEVVDLLTDCKVRMVTWNDFLLGRQPQLWDYPDVPAADPHEIAEFARNLVGQERKYHALLDNCENLAIYCRSLGKMHESAYSQAKIGVEMIRRYPFLGSLLQVMNRGACWITYMLGGTFGKRIAFYPVWLSHQVTDWLIVRQLRNGQDK